MIYSPGDPARNKKRRLLPSHCQSGRIRAATVSWPSSMDSWLGPTRRGTVNKQLSPSGSGPCLGGSWGAGGAPLRSQSGDRAGSWMAGLWVSLHVSQGIAGMHTWKDGVQGL